MYYHSTGTTPVDSLLRASKIPFERPMSSMPAHEGQSSTILIVTVVAMFMIVTIPRSDGTQRIGPVNGEMHQENTGANLPQVEDTLSDGPYSGKSMAPIRSESEWTPPHAPAVPPR